MLRIATSDVGLTLENPNPWPVFYAIADPNFLALSFADFGLCADPRTDCPRVPPYGSVKVPYRAATGFQPGDTELLVTQWLLQKQSDGTYIPTQIQSTRVALPRTTLLGVLEREIRNGVPGVVNANEYE
jgi:hypothetical protein